MAVGRTSGGPDSLRSVIVGISTGLVFVLMLSLFRCSGVIYVEMIHRFGVSRQAASWPFSLSFTMQRLIASPLSGVLAQFTEIRFINMVAAAVGSVSVALCYFATDIGWFIVLVGVIGGLAVGTACTLCPVVMAQYFDKYRSTALGLMFATVPTGAFIFPPLAEYLFEAYSFPGYFLIFGAITANAFAFSMVQSTPSWIKAREKENRKISDSASNGKYTGKNGETAKSVVSSGKVYVNVPKDPTDEDHHHQLDVALNTRLEDEDQVPKVNVKPRTSPKFSLQNVSWLKVFFDPMFYVIAPAYVSYVSGLLLHVSLNVDFAVERGVSFTDAVYIQMAYAVGDMSGCIFFGWVSDRQWFQRKYVIMLGQLAFGIATALVSFVSSFTVFLVVYVFIGLSFGCIVSNFPATIVQYLGQEALSTAIGFSGMFAGMACLLLPPMVGLFKDRLGSYFHLFHVFGAIFIAGGLLWFLEPLIMKKRKAKSSVGNLSPG